MWGSLINDLIKYLCYLPNVSRNWVLKIDSERNFDQIFCKHVLVLLLFILLQCQML